jgi:hypothetical protein
MRRRKWVLEASFYKKIMFKNNDLSAAFRDMQRSATLRNAVFVPRTTIFYETRGLITS